MIKRKDEFKFEDLFGLGMKRWPEVVSPPPDGLRLNLGCGRHPIEDTINLDQPRWKAPALNHFATESTAVIHAYHFLEHLILPTLQGMLLEIARVLKFGGVLNYCVPYALAPIAFMDVTHKTFWTEETMRTLLESRGYESAMVEGLSIQCQWIAGIDSQNLAVLGQLIKTKGSAE